MTTSLSLRSASLVDESSVATLAHALAVDLLAAIDAAPWRGCRAPASLRRAVVSVVATFGEDAAPRRGIELAHALDTLGQIVVHLLVGAERQLIDRAIVERLVAQADALALAAVEYPDHQAA